MDIKNFIPKTEYFWPVKREKIGYTILIASAALVLSGMFFVDPILQDEKYHLFSDSRVLLNIPNFWNVMTNLPILVVGVLGLYKLKTFPANKTPYFLFFFSIVVVALGSCYYHLDPNNYTLVWDRLPMTITFMSLFAIVICEFISVRIGNALLLPLIFLGVVAALFWYLSESGNLLYYALIQFYPMLAIPVILIFFKPKYTRISGYWLLLAVYVIAKIFEHFDAEIYDSLGFISGHSLKHLAIAFGLFLLFDSFRKRQPI